MADDVPRASPIRRVELPMGGGLSSVYEIGTDGLIAHSTRAVELKAPRIVEEEEEALDGDSSPSSPSSPSSASDRLDAALAEFGLLTAGEWDESKVRRHPEGSPAGRGGRFASKGGAGAGAGGKRREKPKTGNPDSDSEWSSLATKHPIRSDNGRQRLQGAADDMESARTFMRRDADIVYMENLRELGTRVVPAGPVRDAVLARLDPDYRHRMAYMLDHGGPIALDDGVEFSNTPVMAVSELEQELYALERGDPGKFGAAMSAFRALKLRAQRAARAAEEKGNLYAYETAKSFWRGTSVKEMGSLAGYRVWGSGAPASGYGTSKPVVCFSASSVIAAGFKNDILLEVDGDAMRRMANGEYDGGSPGTRELPVRESERVPGPSGISHEDYLRSHMAHNLESRVLHGTPVSRLPVKAVHMSKDTAKTNEKALRDAAQVAPVYVHDFMAGPDPTRGGG